MKKRLILIFALVFTLLPLSGCGDSNQVKVSENVEKAPVAEKKAGREKEKKTEGEEDPIELLETGYSVSEDHYMNFGFKYTNNSDKYAYELPKITITAYDGSGDVLATNEQTMMVIQPGEVQAFGFVMDCNGQDPTNVEFTAESGNRIQPSEDVVKSSDLEITGLNDRADEFGGVSFTGKIKNNSNTDTNSVGVTLLLKQNGKIIYGNTTYVDDLNSGSEKPFQMDEFSVPEYDSYEVIGYDWQF